MAQLITEIWEGLRDAGLPEVMLYLADGSASRCHWKDTALIGEVRVALLADQDRQIVRILPVDACTGIGIASPKGVDPSGYRTTVHGKLRGRFGGEEPVPDEPAAVAEAHASPAAETSAPSPAPTASAAVPPPAPSPEPAPDPALAAKADPLVSRWGKAPRSNAATPVGLSRSGTGRPPFSSR